VHPAPARKNSIAAHTAHDFIAADMARIHTHRHASIRSESPAPRGQKLSVDVFEFVEIKVKQRQSASGLPLRHRRSCAPSSLFSPAMPICIDRLTSRDRQRVISPLLGWTGASGAGARLRNLRYARTVIAPFAA
jgi:hypothetical protein